MFSSLKKLWALLSRREKRNAAVLSLLVLVNGMLEMVGVGIVPLYVSVVAFPEKLIENQYIQMLLASPGELITQTTLLYWGSALLLGFFTIKVAYGVLLSYWEARFVHNRVLRLGDKLFTAYMRAPYTFHLGRNSAQLLRNVNTEAQRMGSGVLVPLIDFTTHLCILLAIVGLLIVASPGLASLSLMIFTVAAVIVVGALHKKFKELGIEAQAARGDVVRSVNEGLGGVKEIKVLQRESSFTNRYRESLGTTLRIQRFMQVIGKAIPFMMEWISVAGLLAVVLVLFSTGRPSETVVSIVVLFAVSLARLKGSISSLVSRYTSLQHNLVSLDLIYDDLRELEQAAANQAGRPTAAVYQLNTGADVANFTNTLEMEDVRYRYPGAEDEALKGVSLSIRKGEAIGFVGATGAGKSTLIDIVLGVLRPTSGRVLVDGEDIFSNIGAWQRDIGYIPQSIYLVDGSIKENVALGLPDKFIDDDALNRALKAAHVEEFVHQLPNGVNTIVGERGVRVSGGQRQRVAIARALYHNPDILIMDEATSALDNVTERAVIKAVEELKGERTILMIAHRLSTVRNCDRIVMLEHGRIEGMGTYEDLRQMNESFRRLADA